MLLLGLCVANTDASTSFNSTAIKQSINQIASNVAKKTATTYQNVKTMPVWQQLAFKMTPAWNQTTNVLASFNNEFQKHQYLYLSALTVSGIFLTYLLYKTNCFGLCSKKKEKNNQPQVRPQDNNTNLLNLTEVPNNNPNGPNNNSNVIQQNNYPNNSVYNSVAQDQKLINNANQQPERIVEIDNDEIPQAPDLNELNNNQKISEKDNKNKKIEETAQDKQARLLKARIKTMVKELNVFNNLVKFANLFETANENKDKLNFDDLKNKKIIKFIEGSAGSWISGDSTNNAKVALQAFKDFCMDEDIRNAEKCLHNYLDKKIDNQNLLKNTSNELVKYVKAFKTKYDSTILNYAKAVISESLKDTYNKHFSGITSVSENLENPHFKKQDLEEILKFFNGLTSFGSLTNAFTNKIIFGASIEAKNLIFVSSDKDCSIVPILKELSNSTIGLKHKQWSGRSFNRITDSYGFKDIIERNLEGLKEADFVKQICNTYGFVLQDPSIKMVSSVIYTDNPNLFIKDDSRDKYVEQSNNIIKALMGLDENAIKGIAQDLIDKNIQLKEKEVLPTNNKVEKINLNGKEFINIKNKLKKVNSEAPNNKDKKNNNFNFKLNKIDLNNNSATNKSGTSKLNYNLKNNSTNEEGSSNGFTESGCELFNFLKKFREASGNNDEEENESGNDSEDDSDDDDDDFN